jgi:ribonuclease HII
MKSLAKHWATPPCPPDLLSFDRSFGVPVCGIDEVGRGPLAGPVVAACAFILPAHLDHPVWEQITDSKKLTARKREMLFPLLTSLCRYGIAEIGAAEIDALNIHHATLKAMTQAFSDMTKAPPFIPPPAGRKFAPGKQGGDIPELALIDGKFTPALPVAAKAIVKGDGKSLSIAAASIIAKVYRDRLMARLHTEYPAYGWDKNAGYGTAAHLAGIARAGITPYHRRSFAPCMAVSD